MYNILDNFSTDTDFYSANPQLFMFQPVPSTSMWAVALLEHPKSKYANFNYEERRNLISIDYLKDPEFDWTSIQESIDKFVQIALTDKMRLLRTWRNKLHERDKFIADTPYNASTAEFLDKILANTIKLWEQLRKCEKDILDEESTSAKGGVQESLSELGMLK